MSIATVRSAHQSDKPVTLPVDPEQIPAELKMGRRFMLWRWELRGTKWTKPPLQRDGRFASSTDPETWCSFDEAMGAYRTGKFDGIGRVLTGDDGLIGIDFDHVRSPETGEIAEPASGYVRLLSSYTEVSPSRCGLRVFVKGDLARDGMNKNSVEVYKRGRYLTLTGFHLTGTPSTIEDRKTQLGEFCRLVFGDLRNGNRAADHHTDTEPTGPPQIAEIEDALRYINPDPRENWLKVGMALHHELGEGGQGHLGLVVPAQRQVQPRRSGRHLAAFPRRRRDRYRHAVPAGQRQRLATSEAGSGGNCKGKSEGPPNGESSRPSEKKDGEYRSIGKFT